MPLSPSTRLGSYEILASIGEGGPPMLAFALVRELPRGLAEAQRGPRK